MDKKTITEAYKELAELTEIYKKARYDEQLASTTATNARIAVNKAQKQFDQIVAEVKLNAPPETDWKSARKSLSEPNGTELPNGGKTGY